MEAQGCTVEDVYVYQNNQSTLLIETNGMKSVGDNSRLIKIKYSFITKKVKDIETKIIYFPTKEMTGDLFTKSLQGLLFVIYRNAVLGINQEDMPLYWKHYYTYIMNHMDIDTI